MIEVTQTMVDLPHTMPKMTDPAAGTPAPEPEEDNPVAIGWKAGREERGTAGGGGGAEGEPASAVCLGSTGGRWGCLDRLRENA
jgi:hypothetical protein